MKTMHQVSRFGWSTTGLFLRLPIDGKLRKVLGNKKGTTLHRTYTFESVMLVMMQRIASCWNFCSDSLSPKAVFSTLAFLGLCFSLEACEETKKPMISWSFSYPWHGKMSLHYFALGNAPKAAHYQGSFTTVWQNSSASKVQKSCRGEFGGRSLKDGLQAQYWKPV